MLEDSLLLRRRRLFTGRIFGHLPLTSASHEQCGQEYYLLFTLFGRVLMESCNGSFSSSNTYVLQWIVFINDCTNGLR